MNAIKAEQRKFQIFFTVIITIIVASLGLTGYAFYTLAVNLKPILHNVGELGRAVSDGYNGK